MKPEEAIEELNHELLILKCLIEEVNSFICDCDVDDDEYDDEKEQFEISLTRYKKEKEVIEMAISALKEIQQYREIGTVEECREAREKQKAKKCVQDTCHDHTHYKCPTCGKIQMSEYKRGIRILGRITNFCDNCGQGLESEK